MANVLTIIRIIGTAVLIFIKPATNTFYAIYILGGLTDAFDGLIARATNTVSSLGSKLDSIADMFFYAIMLIKFLPILWVELPKNIWFWVAAIVGVRVASYLIAYSKTGAFSSLHTIFNKATGFSLFLVPFFLKSSVFTIYCAFVCAVATVASIYELIIHINSKSTRKEKVGQTAKKTTNNANIK